MLILVCGGPGSIPSYSRIRVKLVFHWLSPCSEDIFP